MDFSLLAGLFEELEGTSSRNKTIEMIAELLKKASKQNVGKICYFLLGEITAGYKDIKLGLGNEMVKSAISLASEIEVEKIEEKIRETGDLGDVVEDIDFSDDAKFKDVLEVKRSLEVEDVHRGLMKIAKARGDGSQQVKKKSLAALIVAGSKKERKYVVRLAMGAMRLGVGAMTLLDSLSVAFNGSRENRPILNTLTM